MKKFLYICAILLLNNSLPAQIHEENMWSIYFNDDFNGTNRGWNSAFYETLNGVTNSDSLWRCFYHGNWPSGVTLDLNQHHIFQRSHCLFNDGLHYSDGLFRIVAERIDPFSNNSAECGEYEVPRHSATGHYCDTNHNYLYFYSGTLESVKPFRYGYFEIRCKTPIHRGAFPAFWLWGTGRSRYEEIDIFEYMWNITIPNNHNPSPRLGYPYVFNTGLFFDKDSLGNRIHYATKVVRFSEDLPDMNQWHTFGVEWLPGRVVWYFDNEIVNEFYRGDKIPSGHMVLKANYSLDNWSLVNPWDSTAAPIQFEGDTLLIDYIRIYHLNTTCNQDIVVTNASQIDTIQTMKHSLSFISTNPILIPTNTNKTFRAETITLDSEIEIPIGAKVTFIANPCPCWEKEDDFDDR